MELLKCDGNCGATLKEGGVNARTTKDDERVLTLVGERVDGMAGGGLPSEMFHLCYLCATTAFAAIRPAKP